MSGRAKGMVAVDGWYLVHFGSVEIAHFTSEEDLLAYMRLELRGRGVDVRRTSSTARVQQEYLDMVERAGDGPVQWGRVEPETIAAKRKHSLRGGTLPRTFVVT